MIKKILLVLLLLAIAYAFLEGFMRVYDEMWEYDYISQHGIVGYCQAGDKVNTAHKERCKEILNDYNNGIDVSNAKL